MDEGAIGPGNGLFFEPDTRPRQITTSRQVSAKRFVGSPFVVFVVVVFVFHQVLEGDRNFILAVVRGLNVAAGEQRAPPVDEIALTPSARPCGEGSAAWRGRLARHLGGLILG